MPDTERLRYEIRLLLREFIANSTCQETAITRLSDLIVAVTKDQIVIKRYKVDVAVFSAWTRTTITGDCYATVTHDPEHGCLGRIGSKRPPAALVNHLPAGSDERIAAVRDWYDSEFLKAYVAILLAHPELAGRPCRSGSIFDS